MTGRRQVQGALPLLAALMMTPHLALGRTLQNTDLDSLEGDTTTVQIGAPVNPLLRPQLRAGVLSLFSRRNARLAGTVGRGTGIHPGLELSLWLPSPWGVAADDQPRSVLGIRTLGLSARMLGGGFSDDSTAEHPGTEAVGQVNNADLELYAGRRILHARVGYGLRSFTGSFGTHRWSFVRLGARSLFALGSSREFEVTVGAAVYLGVSGDIGGTGREGETRLTFTPQCEPGTSLTAWICQRVTGIVAYRFEQFTAEASAQSGGERPEEVSSVIVGIGFRLAGS